MISDGKKKKGVNFFLLKKMFVLKDRVTSRTYDVINGRHVNAVLSERFVLIPLIFFGNVLIARLKST